MSLSVFEVFAEIDGADLFVVDQVVRLAGSEDGAVADDVGSVADAEGFAYVVVGNEYADAARFEEVDDFLDVDDGNGVDAGEGFVQEDEARLHGEYAGDFDASAFAAGQGRGGVVAQVADVEVGKQFFDFAIDAAFVFGADF